MRRVARHADADCARHYAHEFKKHFNSWQSFMVIERLCAAAGKNGGRVAVSTEHC